MRRYSLSRLVILAGACFVASQAQAQSSYEPGGFMYFDHIQHAAWTNMGINPAVDTLSDEPDDEPTPAVKPLPELTPAALASLSFTASPQRRIANLDKIFADIDVKVPGSGAQLKEAFAANNIYAEVEKVMGTYDLRADNVADTFALFWVASWQAANGIEAEPSKESVAAVKRQAAQAMLAVPAMKTMTPAVKQEMADGLVVSMILLSAAQEGAKADPSQKGALARQANADAQAMGLNHSLLSLTDAGFVPAI
jgi:hypothetical protein